MLDSTLARLMEQKMIERAAGGPNANPPVSERKVPRVSSLTKLCGRVPYYYLTGAPEDQMDALGACALGDGKDMEAGILLDIMAAEGADQTDYEQQVRVESPWFRGSADLVRRDQSGHVLAVYDAKTANAASFAIQIRNGVPSEGYVAQLSLYAFALGAHECVIAYRKKGGTKKDGPEVYAVFRFAPDLALVERVKAQALDAMDARDGHGPIPERAYPRSSWNCDYCSFRTHCWEGK